MKGKYIAIIVFCLTALAVAAALVVGMNKREAVARAARDKAEAEADTAREEARKAASDQAAAEAKRAAEEKAAVAAAENRKAEEARAEAERLALAAAEENRLAAEAERDRVRAASQEAADLRAAEKAKADAEKLARDKAKAEAEAEALRAQAAADQLAREKLASDKVLAEAKLLELKRTDFEAIERALLDFKEELDAREAALRPPRTIETLETTGSGDEYAKKNPGPPRPEDDMSLARSTRALARAERLRDEGRRQRAAETKARVVKTLEGLYIQSVREDRVLDAEFYSKALKDLYPDWRYAPPQKEKAKEEEEK